MSAAAGLLEAKAARALLECLSAGDEQARIVGGAIRNALMGLEVADIDIATTCLPQTVIARAKAAGWKPVPTGLAHGTITVVIEGRPFEVTTLREDVDTDGRHAVVAFGRDFRADAARRDFTINALSMGLDGEIHDYFGGRADIAARRVRFIGDAGQRLREDYLRGLRFLRFSAGYGDGQLDPEGFAAVLAHREGLRGLSRERVRQEVLKLVMAEHALPVIKAAEGEGLISEVLGCRIDPERLRLRLALGDAPLQARLFALTVQDAAALAHLREALRLTNAEARFMVRLLEAEALIRAGGEKLGFDLGDQFPDVALEALMQAAADGDHAILAKFPEVGNPPVFHLSGKDVLALDIRPGPDVARLLAAAKSRWWEDGCPQEKAAQLAILARCAAAIRAI